MTGNEMFLLKRGCGALGLDEIAKEIKEKEDNAMAMEFTKCIGELLKKNGVVPKIKQYGCDFYGENSFQSRFGVIIDELDFTEHDKVFEDEMEILKTQIESYKNSLYSNVKRIGELKCKNELLKQRIAELESTETETCENEPKISDSAPSREWYENRHQTDCIEINRLNTTIDVLIHKVEYLRQFSGLE